MQLASYPRDWAISTSSFPCAQRLLCWGTCVARLEFFWVGGSTSMGSRVSFEGSALDSLRTKALIRTLFLRSPALVRGSRDVRPNTKEP